MFAQILKIMLLGGVLSACTSNESVVEIKQCIPMALDEGCAGARECKNSSKNSPDKCDLITWTIPKSYAPVITKNNNGRVDRISFLKMPIETVHNARTSRLQVNIRPAESSGLVRELAVLRDLIVEDKAEEFKGNYLIQTGKSPDRQVRYANYIAIDRRSYVRCLSKADRLGSRGAPCESVFLYGSRLRMSYPLVEQDVGIAGSINAAIAKNSDRLSKP